MRANTELFPKDGYLFQKSSHSPKGEHCVAITFRGSDILVTDTKDIDAPILTFTLKEWDAFLKGVKDGEFDLPEGRL